MTDEETSTVRREDIFLDVWEIDGEEITIVFPSHLLEMLSFRATIPMQCLASGETDYRKLIARPLAWVDRLEADKGMTAREFSDRFAKRISQQMSEKHYVHSLFPIEQLPRPFNLPMPYYVSEAKDLSVEVPCRVIHMPYGVGCQVRMPLTTTILTWIARVNGICSPEYAQVEALTARRQNQAWLSLPDNVRQRLGGWFEWIGDERFLIFLPDAEFTRSDDGLAGLVLTSNRLIFRKYRKQGALPLDQPGQLLLKWDGAFSDLYFSTAEGQMVQTVRLRRESAQALQLLIQQTAPKFSVIEQ